MPDGFDDIMEQHRIVLDLLDHYARDADDGVARKACTEIAMHTEAEEMTLYPHLRELGPGEDPSSGMPDGIQLADRAELDHATVGAQVARVLAAPPIDLRDAMAQITEQIREHIIFEERELLPRLRPLINAEELHESLTAARDTISSRAGEPMF